MSIAKEGKHLRRQRTQSKEERRVKFPHEIVFDEMVKDGDSSEIVNFLRRGSVDVDINKRNDRGRTALKDLIMNDNLKCVKVLVDQGADVNKRDENGEASSTISRSTFHHLIFLFVINS